MNTTKNTNEVLNNVYMSNNYAAPISNDELNEINFAISVILKLKNVKKRNFGI